MGRKTAHQQVMTKGTTTGHKQVGVTPPFVGSKKPAPATPAPNKGIAPKGSKKGMC